MDEADRPAGFDVRGPSVPPGPPPEPDPPRRLYREPEDKRIAGVCSGLGDYLGIDATIVRLATIALALSTGVVVIAYIIAAVVVPQRPRSVRRPASHREASSWAGSPLLIVLVVIAIFGLGGLRWWVNAPMVAICLVALRVWLLVADRDDGPRRWWPEIADQRQDSTTDSDKITPPLTAGSVAGTTLPGDAMSEGEFTPADAAGDQTDDDDHATMVFGAATDDSAVSADLQGEVPPPVPPWGIGSPLGTASTLSTPSTPHVPLPPARSAPPRGAGLPLGVLASLLIGAGVLSLFAMLGVGDIGPTKAIALGLLVVGVALVVGTWRGNARPLVWLGLPAMVLLLVIDLIEVPFDAGVGDRTRVIDNRAELDGHYELTAGTLTLDLREAPLVAPTSASAPTLSAEVGLGELVVILPPEVNARVDADVGAGEVTGDPAGNNDGVDVNQSFDIDGEEGGGWINLDLQLGFGEIEVRHG